MTTETHAPTPGFHDIANWRQFPRTRECDGATAVDYVVMADYEADGRWYHSVIHEGCHERVARLIGAAPEILDALSDLLVFGRDRNPDGTLTPRAAVAWSDASALMLEVNRSK